MQRGKRLRALLMDNRGRLSIRSLEQSPARLPALAHRAFVRTGVDLKRGLFVYEQDPETARQASRLHSEVNKLAEKGHQ